MSKIKALAGVLIVLLFLLSSCDTPTPEEFSVGHIEYQLIDFELKEGFPGAEMGANLLENSTISMFYNEDMELMIMDMMGGFSITKVLFDRKNEQVTSYLHSLGDKMMLKVEVPEDAQGEITVVKDESNRKEILGFDSYKVEMTMDVEGMAPQNVKAYITEKIKPRSSFIQPAHNNPFDGVPLKLTAEDQNVRMIFEAVEFNEEFDESVFHIDESEYQEFNMEEVRNMGMLGQMGF